MTQFVHLAENDDSEHVIEVRRLGSLACEIVSVLGNPVGNATVEIRSVELDTWASDWVRSGVVKSSSIDMKTDAQGHLRFDGLPNGEFDYRVTPPNGEPLTGRIVVPPHAVGTLAVRVP